MIRARDDDALDELLQDDPHRYCCPARPAPAPAPAFVTPPPPAFPVATVWPLGVITRRGRWGRWWLS